MKFLKLPRCVTALGLAFISFSYAESESTGGAILDSNQCYYWIGLHDSKLFEYEPDQLRALIAELSEEGVAKGSERRRATLLLSARLNRIEIDPDTLSGWMSNLTGTPERKTDEDNLIHEIVMTLGAQGLENELQAFLNSDSLPVREEAYSALLFYADQADLASMRKQERERTKSLKAEAQEVVEAYKSNPKRGAELAKQLARKGNFAPSAVGQLKDYFAYQTYEKSDGDWLRMIAKNGLLDMRSTATNRGMFSHGNSGYLEDSLTNKFFLQKLNEIFEKASSRSERLELERVFRDASAKSGLANEIYNTPLFYLLGFELTDEEKAYLMEEAGLSEDQILPTGQMHLIGYELENSRSAATEIPPVSSEAPKVKEIIQEVAQPEPVKEEPAAVAPVEVTEEPTEHSSNWWLWLIGAVIIVGGGVLFIRSKNERLR